MSSKKSSSNTLQALAAELEILAADLRSRRVNIDGSSIALGEPLFLKTKQKLKDGQIHYTLTFQAPVSDHKQKPQQGAAAEKTAHLPVLKRTSTSGTTMEGTPPDAKRIKKEISRLWKDIGKHLAEGEIPPETLKNNLLKKCDDYCQYTDPAWHDKWLACTKVLKAAMQMATPGKIAEALTLLAEVNTMIKSCHREFK